MMTYSSLIQCAIIPDRFKNYKERAGEHYQTKLVLADHLTTYDVDHDGIMDVLEKRVMYPNLFIDGKGYMKVGRKISKHPYLYAFDMNCNGKFEDNESMYDRDEDGDITNAVWLEGGEC